MKKEEFLLLTKKLYKNKFDYSDINYIDDKTIIDIKYKEFIIKIKPIDNLNKDITEQELKNQIFIKKAKDIHGDKYDYTKVHYIKNSIKVIIGYNGTYYDITPANHLKGSKLECRKTYYTKETYIEKCNTIFNNFYNYTLTEIGTTLKTHIRIICPIHGEFKQMADSHIQGHGCNRCGKDSMKMKKKNSLEHNLERIKKKHGDRYKYLNLDEKTKIKDTIIIICPIHGEFKQKLGDHLNYGCNKCGYIRSYDESRTINFIEKSKKLYNGFYLYDKTIYIKSSDKVIINCPIHGDFEQNPNSHLSGRGCKKCGYLKNGVRLTQEDFIKKSNEAHNFKYDYSKSIYKTTREFLTIICPKHGDFNQSAGSHMYGTGCPICNESKGEKRIAEILDLYKVNYTRRYKFDDCININKLEFDFYIEELNTCIEFDGIQHFAKIPRFEKFTTLEYRQKLDKIKDNYCENKNIRLLRIDYKNFKNIEKILKKEFGL